MASRFASKIIATAGVVLGLMAGVYLTPSIQAQIGYSGDGTITAGGSGTDTTVPVFNASGELADSNITDDGLLIRMNSASTSSVGIGPGGGSSGFWNFLPVPSAGLTGNSLAFLGTLNAMDGNDNYTTLQIAIIQPGGGHSGATNTIQAIDIASLSGDANVLETAIRIGDGYDRDMELGGGSTINDGANALNITAAAGSGNLNLIAETANGTVNTSMMFGSRTSARFFGRAAAGGSGDLLDVGDTLNAMNGSDTINGIDVAITNGAHTGAGNLLRGLNVAAITGSANAIEYGTYVQDGWDVGSRQSSVLQANLVAADNGSIVFCSDCNPDATCTAAGAGAFAFRIGGAWTCELN